MPFTRPGTKVEILRFMAGGSQVVLPPSVHRSGTTYRWKPGHAPADRAAAPAPVWLLAPRPQARRAPPAAGEVIAEGGRNSYLASLAGAMRRVGADEDAILAGLLSTNDSRLDPPLDRGEVEKIARSIARYDPAPPGPAVTLGGKPVAVAKHGVEPPAAPRLVTRRASTITSMAVDWLWRGYLPFGMLSEINGDPGDGKGTLSADFVAHATRGRPFPFAEGPGCNPVNALWLSAEDSAEHSLVPRLEAAGAELDRVDVLDHVGFGGERFPLVLPDHLPLVRGLVAERAIKLVIVDPLNGFLSGKLDSHNDANVRAGLLYPLQKMAEESGAAVVSVRHLNKMAGGKGVYRAGGSIAYTGAARVSLMVGTDPEDADRRALAVVKSNVGAKPPSIEYAIDSFHLASTDDTVSKVRWVGVSALSAGELGSAPAEKGKRTGSLRAAEDFLRQALATGPVPALTVIERASAAGVAEKTLYRAKDALGVGSRKAAFGGCWEWHLPAAGPEGGQQTPPPLFWPPSGNPRGFPEGGHNGVATFGGPPGADDPPFADQF